MTFGLTPFVWIYAMNLAAMFVEAEKNFLPIGPIPFMVILVVMTLIAWNDWLEESR